MFLIEKFFAVFFTLLGCAFHTLYKRLLTNLSNTCKVSLFDLLQTSLTELFLNFEQINYAH